MLQVTRVKLFVCLCALAAGCTRSATIRALVPEGTPVVYAAGSVPSLGNWDPERIAMRGTGSARELTVDLDGADEAEFKLTLGSWSTEALGADGRIMQNQRLRAGGVTTVEVSGFKADRSTDAFDDPAGGGVLGTLVTWRDVRSTQGIRARTVQVWLPPEYDPAGATRHPVIYAHDGQNLFDPRLAAFGTDWGLDEAIVELCARTACTPPIVVAVWNTPDRRREYCPWGLGDRYAAFLIDELMPKVNAEFRTRTDAAATMTLGSSMGGLISFHLCRTHPERFGLGACVSTHVPFSAADLARANGGGAVGTGGAGDADRTPLILRDIEAGMAFPKGPRLWFDYGTEGLDAAYGPIQAKVDAWLEQQGLVRERDFTSRRFDGADHSERAWRARVGQALAFLLAPVR
jgi:hypothetical protein